MSPGTRHLLPTGAWLRALMAPALVFIATAIDRNYQTDFWHHLARGRAIAQHGGLVDQDLFTYTVHGQPFQDTNWLSQLLYYGLYEWGGLALVQTVNSLTLAAMMGLLVWLCWRKGGSLLLAGAFGVFAFFGLWQLLIIRPQTFSLFLFALLYAVLERADEPEGTGRRRWLFVVPPFLMMLWVNLHGGFPIGLLLIGCFFVAACWEGGWDEAWGLLRAGRARAYGLCLAACVLATLVNPYGWRVYQYVRTTSATASARRIDEWVPPGVELLVGKMWVLSVLLLLVLFALPRRRPTVREVCLVLCFLPLACGSVRMVAWWLIVSLPIAAALLAANLPRHAALETADDSPSLLSGAFCGALVLAMLLSAPFFERYNPLFGSIRQAHREEDDLAAIAEHLPAQPDKGRIFSRFEWGEYLSWSVSPTGYTIFMDGRIEIFPDDVWTQYSAVTRGRADWEEILDRYQVDCLVLDEHYHADLLPQVQRSGHWEKVFTSGKATLFQRSSAQMAHLPR